jgi:DNA-binding response OmpR family regulator
MTTTKLRETGARVLVVDDSEELRLLLTVALRGKRLAVDTASDGREAIEKLSVETYRVLALDLMMPEVSGWDVIEWMIAHPERKPHTVIVLTANDRDVLQKLKPVVNAVIFKPFDVVEVAAYVAACCKAPRERRRKRVVGKRL